jgi:hypothetical protein
VGFELTTPAGERPQTYALDRADTGTGLDVFAYCKISVANDKLFLKVGTVFPLIFHTSYIGVNEALFAFV